MIIRYSYNSDQFEHKLVTASDSITIGRQGGKDRLELLQDPKVSREHAKITRVDGTFYIEDLESSNKTWLNNKPLVARVRTALKPEDIVQIGDTKLKIEQPPDSLVDEGKQTNIELFIHGAITATIANPESPADLLDTVDSSQMVRRYLTAFYELDAALSSIHKIDDLIKTVVEHVWHTIPGVDLGGLLLDENGSLALKMYTPADKEPSYSRTLAKRALDKRQAFLWQYNIEDLSLSLKADGIQSAMYAPLIWKGERIGVLYAMNTTNHEMFTEEDLRLLTAIANQSAMVIKNFLLQQTLFHEELVLSNLLRQFSPKVAGQILTKLESLELGGNYASPVTVLVSDVRGFTAMSARSTPNQVVELLNRMFATLIPIVFKYDGTVDKFVGDAILAVFGSPEPDEKQWEKALRAALEMQEGMKQMADECQIGIALHTGAVMHGFIGAPERMEYTIIGDTVNRASRFCDAAGRGEVVISKEMYEKVADLIETEPTPKKIPTKHPESEPDMELYVVKGLKASLP